MKIQHSIIHCLKFSFKLVDISKSYARKQKQLFFMEQVYIDRQTHRQTERDVIQATKQAETDVKNRQKITRENIVAE